MKTYKIHLIRDAQTKESVEGKYIGHLDAKLSEEGIAQIEQMKQDYIYPYADVVFCSPLSRCVDTARLIYPDAQIVTVNDLIEYNFGEFEGKDTEELKDEKKYPLFEKWLRGEDVAPPFGETNTEFLKRVCTCFASICEGIMKTGCDDTAIVTHGGVIMTLMAAFALPEAAMSDWLTPNGCGYTLRLDPSIWMAGQKMEAYREIPHKPINDENYYDGWDYYPTPEDLKD